MKEEFIARMRKDLGDETDAWLKTLEDPRFCGMRISGLKQPLEKTMEFLPDLGRPGPFCSNNWYVAKSQGLIPEHIQGLVYMQEPSASAAVAGLDLQPDDTVLDLCAAPGSKSTQIAEKIPQGFLAANEYDAGRAQILLSNLERMGAENFICTSMDSGVLCGQLPEFFDKILVDAPCSGEGMMKKHEKAASEWSVDNILLCAARQKEILSNAWQSLKPGGRLVYSTCTYAREENEEIVSWLLKTFPDARQVLFTDASQKDFGRPGFETDGMDASLVRRIFPMDGGDGHFMAAFEKAGEQKRTLKAGFYANEKPDALTQKFLNSQLQMQYSCLHSDQKDGNKRVFVMDRPFLKLKKGTVLRQGVYAGDVVKNRFEPAHAFFMSRRYAEDGLAKTETSLEQMDSFMHGNQLCQKEMSGWRALSYRGIPYGFGKSDGSRITCRLPKGLRLLEKSRLHEMDPADAAGAKPESCLQTRAQSSGKQKENCRS